MPICEFILNQILYRDPTLINLLNKNLPHTLINNCDYFPYQGENQDLG